MVLSNHKANQPNRNSKGQNCPRKALRKPTQRDNSKSLNWNIIKTRITKKKIKISQTIKNSRETVWSKNIISRNCKKTDSTNLTAAAIPNCKNLMKTIINNPSPKTPLKPQIHPINYPSTLKTQYKTQKNQSPP